VNAELPQVLELSDKDYEVEIIKTLQADEPIGALIHMYMENITRKLPV
jgi:hypothetical protein